MSGIVVVAYPRTDKSTFDIDYYLKTHMPLADKAWKPLGLKSWKVSKLNEDGPYTYTTVMEFESDEAFGKAAAHPDTAAVMNDVPNFSNESPILLHGDVVKQG